MKFWVSQSVRSERMHNCITCEHYVAQTKTCGPLGFGKKVGTRELCGCIMPVKTQLKWAECPLGKWQAQITKEQIAEVEEALQGITHHVTADKNKELQQLSNKLFGRNNAISNCRSCVRKMIDELRDLVMSSKTQ